MRTEATKLWKQALNELSVAEALINAGHYAAASFHSQQAGEMALKAVFIQQHGGLYTQHKLYELAKKLSTPTNVYRAASRLTPVYLETRYFDARPDGKVPSEEYTKDDATSYYNDAQEITQWAHTQLTKKN